MLAPQLHPDESRRLEALRSLDLLDTPAEAAFDDLARVAAALVGAPIAAISLIDAKRQWFKAAVGIDVREMPREVTFCAHVLLGGRDGMVVEDARSDHRFRDHPLTRNVEAPIVFYAGLPIHDRGTGMPVGALCVIDHRARTLDPAQRAGLAAVVRLVESRIEERRLLREASADKARLLATLSSSPNGVVLIDRQGVCTFVNAAWSRLSGMDPAEAQGSGWLDTMHPEDRAMLVERWLHGRRDGESYSGEIRLRRRDGTLAWCTFHAADIVDGDRSLGRVAILEDITRRRRQERSLRESEARLLEAQAIANVGNFTLDVQSGEAWWSPQLNRIFGLDPAASATAERFLAAAHDEDRQRLEQALRATWSGGPTLDLEYRLRHRDGTERWVHARAIARPGPDGSIAMLRGTVRDITEQVEAHRALVQAKEVAEQAARAKADFLAVMSHEIRTPLNGVIGMTEILLQSELGPDQRDYAETALSSGQVLLSLINDILDFSKLEAGKVRLEAIPFTPRGLVEEAAAILAERCHAKGVELVVDVAGTVPDRLIGDPGRLKQVVVNLLANAAKFTEEGEVLAQVSGARRGDAFDLRIQIRDTGIGMDEAQVSELFTPFHQGDVSTTRRFGGSGLGLAVCRRLVDLMGGRIEVRSTPSIGTTIDVILDLPVERIQSEDEFDLPDGLRVLVIDANRNARAATVAILEGAGLEADIGDDLQSIVGTLEGAQAPGLIVVGGDLPGMLGFTGIHALREAHGDALPPIIASVPVTRRSGVPEGLLAGVILRPVRRGALLGALVSALRGMQPTVCTPVAPGIKGRIRALVAEDNPVNQMVVASLLRRLDCDVDVVSDGRKAVEACAAITYDLIFMDCLMPILDGYAATRAIRSRERPAARLPIIALTANALEGDRERCLRAGMDDYLAKPIDAARLRAVVQRWGRLASRS